MCLGGGGCGLVGVFVLGVLALCVVCGCFFIGCVFVCCGLGVFGGVWCFFVSFFVGLLWACCWFGLGFVVCVVLTCCLWYRSVFCFVCVVFFSFFLLLVVGCLGFGPFCVGLVCQFGVVFLFFLCFGSCFLWCLVVLLWFFVFVFF